MRSIKSFRANILEKKRCLKLRFDFSNHPHAGVVA